MSDNWLTLILKDPRLVPERALQDAALSRFSKLVARAEAVEIHTHDAVQFFDCGENFELTSCPTCRAQIPTTCWIDSMDVEFQRGFPLAAHPLPCCGIEVTLNDLVYDSPQGFARFALSALKPRIGRLPDDALEELEAILGTEVRVIYQRL